MSSRSPVTPLRGAATIVMYHAIASDNDIYSTAPAAFERHLATLSSAFEIVRLRDLPGALRRAPARRIVALTFDDAFLDFYEVAYPILRASALPATVFVPTGLIGKSNVWDAHTGSIPQRPIMTAAQVRELHDGGLVDFGSHTISHPSMASLSRDEMLRQAGDSRQALEHLLGTEIRTFAYPYGQLDNFSADTREALSAAGYELAVTTHWGTLDRPSDPLALPRVHFHKDDSRRTILSKVSGLQNWRGSKERLAFALRSFRRKSRRTNAAEA